MQSEEEMKNTYQSGHLVKYLTKGHFSGLHMH
jgi:hypothetical protein